MDGPPGRADERFAVADASLADVVQALSEGRVTASSLVRAYRARIATLDRAVARGGKGPQLNSVRAINPDAGAIAAALDGTRPSPRQPLAGVPILLKDNIATGDRQRTTAGSLALADAGARDDASLVKRLRAAGAVILGKANLTEFANFLAVDMPAGYSSLGGQVRNPWAPALRDHRDAPLVSPGGSSSGSAVAVAAGLCAAAIGTETSGSLLSPATQNGLVTVKPTVGLISRAGILPIAHSQDTAGPLTRTVRDSALLLNVLAARDRLDPVTRSLKRPKDYTAGLDRQGLKGARIGVPSDPDDPLNDVYFGKLPPRAQRTMKRALEALQDCGARLVRASLPTAGWIGGPGTTMPVLNRNPLSRNRGALATPPIVFVYEIRRDLDLYLRDWATGTRIRAMADIIAFNEAHARRALRFGQDLFLAAQATRGDLREAEYRSARAMDLRAAKALGLDAYMERHRLDAVVFPGAMGASIAAKAGYPSVQVPAGFMSGVDGRETPDFPIGLTFTGRAWSEPALLRFAYAYEQASRARRPPPGLAVP
ncbi:amidase family protein [Reyranella sp.]|uniref:amidase family protein n=1 Tax=Reyranella sp. TaxID=1929291 RepID=UPI003BAA59CC